MAGYQTGAPELTKAAKDMEDTNQQLQGQLSQLANAVSAVQGAWAGSAATAFQTLMEKFASDAAKLNQSLQQIAEQVSGSADAYARQEEEASQSVSNITATLGG